MSTKRREENQLSIRQKGQYWQVRGTFKKLGQRRVVSEHSTGETSENSAWRYVDRLEQELEYQIVHNEIQPNKTLTFEEGLGLYLAYETPNAVDANTLVALVKHFGSEAMASIDQIRFNEYLKREIQSNASSTKQRHASVFNRIYKYVEEEGIKCPDIRVKRKHKKRIRWLPVTDADRLCEAYAPHARPIAYTLRLTGLRTQECLQMQKKHIDLGTQTIWVPPSKNGESRTSRDS